MFSLRLITAGVSAVFLLIVGTLMRFRELYFMSAVLLCIPFISYGISALGLRKLRCFREAPERVFEGDPVPVWVRVEGATGFLGPIEVVDQLPEWLVRDDETRSIAEEQTPELSIARYRVLAEKRGEYTIDSLRLSVSDPLGFFLFTTRFPLTTRITVLPRPLRVDGLRSAAGGSISEFVGTMDGAGARGSGIDFHGVREYRVGDELRRVHWPSTARHGRLNVMEFENTPVRDIAIALDLQKGTEKGEGKFTTLEYAVKIAAGIAEETIATGGAVSLVGAGIDGPSAAPGRGETHLYAIREELARVEANREEALHSALLSRYEYIGRTSSLICLVSTVTDEFVRAIDILSARGIGIAVTLLTLDGEADLPLSAVAALGSVGASVSVVGCSTTAPEGILRHEYTA